MNYFNGNRRMLAESNRDFEEWEKAEINRLKKSHEFTCEGCDQILQSTVTQKELETEYESLYGEPVGDENVVHVCDSCYEIVIRNRL